MSKPCSTRAQLVLASELKTRGLTFLANSKVRCSSGKTFTPDLLIEDNLVVEVLGSIHWKAKVRTKDIVRSEALRASGFEVLEVLNDEVFRDVRKVADLIQVELVNLRGGA